MKLYNLPEDLDIYNYYKNALDLTLYLTDETGAVFELDGYTSVFSLRSSKDSTTNTFTVNGVISTSTGEITFTRSNSLMATLAAGIYYWDVSLVLSGVAKYGIGGTFYQSSETKHSNPTTANIKYVSDTVINIKVQQQTFNFTNAQLANLLALNVPLEGTPDGETTIFQMPSFTKVLIFHTFFFK